jgi:type IV secretion system protein VirD4
MQDFMRNIRNILIISLIWILVISSCFVIGIYSFNFLAFGPNSLVLNISVLENYLLYMHWYISNFENLTPEMYDYMGYKLLGSMLLPYLILAIIVMKRWRKIKEWRPLKKKETIHGDAKWASEEDVEKAGLRQKDGMLLGKDDGGYYVAGGYQHALLFAPTGSGKGVGFVIPNLLYWRESVLVHDIKLENHEITSGWRANKLKQKVFVWAPAEPDGITHCYNPIDWVSSKPGQMVDDVQKIANLILPEKEFWQNEARSLFVGIVLYLIAVPDKIKSFGEVVRTMRSDDVVYNLAVVMDTIGKYLHPVAYMNIAAFLQKADKERSGVISTMNSSLELWANPLIDAATATSDFNIQNFKRDRTTVYVGLTPDNIQRLEPLMKVFYQQATEFLSRKIPKKHDEPYGVLFLMDEFPTLGKMEQFKSGIAYFRGYNVRLFMIIQDTEQLKGIYEEAGMNTFLSNSTYRITFSANNIQTAELISKMVGNKTVEQVSQNRPKFLDFNPASRSLHVSETQRALLLPQEVINLPRDEQIVLIEAFPPIKSYKIKFYEDKFFLKRLLPPSHIPTQEPFDPNKFNRSTVKRPKKDEEKEDKSEDKKITDDDEDDEDIKKLLEDMDNEDINITKDED